MNGWLDKTCVHSKKRKEISDISYFWLWAKRRDKKILSRWLWLKWFTARSRARPVNCPKSITSFQSRCGVPKRLRQVIMQDFFQFLTRNSNKNLQLSQLLLSSDVTTKKMMMKKSHQNPFEFIYKDENQSFRLIWNKPVTNNSMQLQCNVILTGCSCARTKKNTNPNMKLIIRCG